MHVVITFSEPVTPESAGNSSSYRLTEVASGEGHGHLAAIVTGSKTVMLNTVPMDDDEYEVAAYFVEDWSGNYREETSMTFRGSTEKDHVSPSLIARSPEPGATGVALDQYIEVNFSEGVRIGGHVTVAGGGEELDVSIEGFGGYDYYRIYAPLKSGTIYSVTLSGVEDFSGNSLPYAKWSFTTTSVRDTTAPTLVSSSPGDGDENVSLRPSIELEFSEMLDRDSFAPTMTPPIAGYVWWWEGGKHYRLLPSAPLLPETQYTISIPAGAMRDGAGNPNVESYAITFLTAAAPPVTH
jgi:methionine-rich copper-binding protein CopC